MRNRTTPFVANPKAAVAFAVVVMLAAMIGAPILSQFVPNSSSEDYESQASQGAQPAERRAPAQPIATWVDDGSSEHDSEEKGLSAEEEIFGDFALQNRERDAPSEAPPQARTASSTSTTNPSIKSGAAPDAPKLQAPGDRRERGKLQVVS